MALLVIPPIKTAIAHPRKQPIVLPPQLDPSCVLCLLPLRDTKWRDFSGEGNHGTLYGPVWTAKGRLGPTLEFDGLDDCVNISHAVSLDITDTITVEAWIKWSGYTTAYAAAVSHGNDCWIFGCNQSSDDGKLGWLVYAVGWGVTSVSVPRQEWHHLVGTYDKDLGSNQVKLYLDGNLGDQVGKTVSLPIEVKPVYIGRYHSLGEYFNGSIDSVRIYNRALEAYEIKALYELGREVRS